MDQLHQQIAVDPVSLLNRRMVQLAGLLVEVDLGDVAKLLAPMVDQRRCRQVETFFQ
jgi:hypothetical protein